MRGEKKKIEHGDKLLCAQIGVQLWICQFAKREINAFEMYRKVAAGSPVS